MLFNSCENGEDLFVENPNVEVLANSVDSNIEFAASNSNASTYRGPTITFGRYYGKCQGNACVEIFRLIENILLEDVLDKYPASGAFYEGDFVNFKGSDKIKTNDMLSNFPLELLGSKLITYGTPDAGDWGGVYLEYQDGFQHRSWLLDLRTNNVPKYLRPYVTLIDKKITEIADINNLN
ncbi:MAG: hypothetical protein COA88_01105 [Kordia sp.]|nr:MAG: hypothetical protein COA88_01105 [Kordia sp.]